MSTGTWMEAWTIPGTTLGSPPVKKIAFIPATSYSWTDPVSEVGRGSLSVPAAYDRLNEILDPDTNTYSMIRVKRPNGSFGGSLVTSWLARRFEDRDSDKEYDLAHIGGDSILGLLQVGILPFDYPVVDAKGRSADPHWQWGSEEDAVGFEERTGDLTNWGAEEGSTNSWYTSQATELVNEPISFTAVNGAGADTGLWYFEFTGLNNSWVGRRFTTLHASRYNVAVRVKAAAGVDYRVRSGPASAVFSGTLFSDFVAYKDGVGNGAWQTVTLEYDAYHLGGEPAPFTPGDSWVEIVNIDGALATIQIDEGAVDVHSTSIQGNGIGVDDWRFTGEVVIYGTKAFAHSGDWSMVYLPGVEKTTLEYGSIYRVFDVTPGVTYTMDLWVYHEEAADRDFRLVLQPPGTALTEVFGDSGVVAVPPDTWTRISATGIVPTTLARIEARFFYWETSPPVSELFVDDDLFFQGMAEMSWTDIVDMLIDDLSLNHVGDGFVRLAFVKHDSYTSTTDSDGVTLNPPTVTYRAEVGKNLLEVLEDGYRTWGYEFELVDLETPSGSNYVELKIYVEGGMGTDYSLGAPPPSSPSIVTGTNVLPTEIVKSMPVNDLTFQGDDGLIVREVNQALIDAAGAFHTYDNNPDVLTIAAAMTAATTSLGRASETFGIKTSLVESDQHSTPYYDFRKGDNLRVTLTPSLASSFHRVMAITGSVEEEDQAQFEVDWTKRVFASNPKLAQARAVDIMWKQFRRRGRPTAINNSVQAPSIANIFGGDNQWWVLATAGSSAEDIASADVVCDGVADNIDILNGLINHRNVWLCDSGSVPYEIDAVMALGTDPGDLSLAGEPGAEVHLNYNGDFFTYSGGGTPSTHKILWIYGIIFDSAQNSGGSLWNAGSLNVHPFLFFDHCVFWRFDTFLLQFERLVSWGISNCVFVDCQPTAYFDIFGFAAGTCSLTDSTFNGSCTGNMVAGAFGGGGTLRVMGNQLSSVVENAATGVRYIHNLHGQTHTVGDHAGVTGMDHGGLTGLGDDDHPQYLTEAEADALYDPLGAGTDPNAIHDNVAGEIAALTTATVASGDFVLIEDVSDSNNKKKAVASDFFGSGTDPDAIHDNVAGEIAAVAEKTTPVNADVILIEDSAASNVKKKVQIGNLPGGGGGAAAWTTYTPTWTGAVTNPAIGNGTITGAYRINGKNLEFRINLTMGSTTTYGSGNWSFGLPTGVGVVAKTGARQIVAAVARDTGTAFYVGMARIASAATTFTVAGHATVAWQSTTPHTWANTDELEIQGLIEID